MGQIRDFFRSDFSAFGAPAPNALKSDLKKPRICPIWGQSDPLWSQTYHPCPCSYHIYHITLLLATSAGYCQNVSEKNQVQCLKQPGASLVLRSALRKGTIAMLKRRIQGAYTVDTQDKRSHKSPKLNKNMSCATRLFLRAKLSGVGVGYRSK